MICCLAQPSPPSPRPREGLDKSTYIVSPDGISLFPRYYLLFKTPSPVYSKPAFDSPQATTSILFSLHYITPVNHHISHLLSKTSSP